MTAAQRATALRVCAAIYGLGVAISMTPLWVRPAPSGQPPGFMTSLGYDASASLYFVASLIVIPFIASLIWGPLLDRLASDETRRWARNAAAIALLSALWTALQTKNVLWTAAAPAVAVLAAFAARRIRADFTRRDLILLPTIATVFLALLDIASMPFDQIFMIAVFLVFAVRVGIVLFRPDRGLDPALCFVLSPLAVILQTHFFARDQRHFGWPPLLIALLTPIAIRFLAPRRAERFLRVALAWVIYPIFCYAYLSAGSLFSAEEKPRAAIFEDAQHIVPAHEMMRGEHAYRDIIPPHGFVQDALLDYLLMRRGDHTLGRLLKSRGTISALNSMATYAVGVAATGSPEAGLVSFLLAVTTGGGGGSFRFLAALITLAITLQAVRRRQPRLLAWAGACAVFAFMTSLDFGVYAGLTLLFAVTRFPGRRWPALRDAAIGGAIVAAIFAIGFAVAGILSDFVRVTFTEVATLGPVYALSLFDPPAGLEASRVVPELLAYFVEQTSYLYLIWVATLIFLVVALTMRMEISARRRARLDTLVVLAAFVVVCSIAYAERHHLYFKTVVPALLIATVATMLHARLPAVRLGGWAVALLVLILARPTVHLSITAMLRHARGPIDPTVREIVDIVRARGALFPARDAAMITSVNRYVPLHVPPGATFFDFTNRGLLYFLFDRDCPIRQIEVAFYESEDRQREVIARIERNPNVRAALVPPSANAPDVDGVPNAVRAPLVWQYLQQHFTPDFQEGDVVFWRRVEFPK